MSYIAAIFTSRWTYLAVRTVLGVMFLVAGVIKLADPASFAVVVDAFGLLPRPLVGVVSYAMPVAEVVAGAGLIFDKRGSLTAVAVMTALFLLILGYGMYLGLDIDCGCYGPGDPEGEAFSSMRDAFKRDLFMTGGILFLLLVAVDCAHGEARIIDRIHCDPHGERACVNFLV